MVRRKGRPRTDAERKRMHQSLYGTKKLPPRGSGLKKSKKKMCYKSPTSGRVRCGYPQIHTSKTGKQFIMVRKRGGGTKRLYLTKFGNIPEKYRPKK